MYSNYACIGNCNALDIQAPEYILPEDHFQISCRGTKPVRMKVHNCPVRYDPPQKEEGEYYANAYVTHVEKACEVQCISGTLTETKKIPVIGKLV